MRDPDMTLDKCKTCNAKRGYYKVVEDDTEALIGFNVVCMSCKIETPVFPKEFEAMVAWNKMMRFEIV